MAVTSDGRGIAGQVEQAAEQLAHRRVGVVVAAGPPGGTHVAARGDTGRGRAPDAHSLFEIGSITKTFTTLLLADGVVRGRWRLDTPVRELLPDGVAVVTALGSAAPRRPYWTAWRRHGKRSWRPTPSTRGDTRGAGTT
ncbi:hypothetical protein HMPREF3086_17405 [Dietzia sp. HMSC21D01]|nr:hypothetical protein A2U19_14240 [Dietzia maris]OFS13169.1 hypothetical protein HMPREF3086_17405 [Dietzia sp. HMSC21D01]